MHNPFNHRQPMRNALLANASFASTDRHVMNEYANALCKGNGTEKRALMNVEIRDSRENRNELDAVVLHGNTCFVIEDKTRNMKKNNVADAAVYKLAHLSRTMGLRAQGLLISAMNIRPEDKQRAQAYGVRVIDSLSNLEANLKQILKSE